MRVISLGLILRYRAPPQKTAVFFNERFIWLVDTGKDALKNKIMTYTFLFAKGRSSDDVGGGGKEHRFSGERYGRELVSKPTGDFVKEKLGGGGVLP